jgi:predicted transcriptional regulator
MEMESARVGRSKLTNFVRFGPAISQIGGREEGGEERENEAIERGVECANAGEFATNYSATSSASRGGRGRRESPPSPPRAGPD